jgi:lipoate-protein ligase A
MSKKPDSVIKKIFEREEDRKISKQQIAQTLRNTITQILAPLRRPSNPSQDDLMLTDSDKDFKQQDEKRAELLELINRYTS